MPLYTRTGDDGSTGLFGGARVAKDDPRIEAIGSIDELNCALGLARSACRHADLAALLRDIQNTLFEVGAELARPPGRAGAEPALALDPAPVQALERSIDALCERLPPLSNFVLPGGVELAARLHHARAVCRCAERRCVTLKSAGPGHPLVSVYLNRLGDLLFAMARRANQLEGIPDDLWLRG